MIPHNLLAKRSICILLFHGVIEKPSSTVRNYTQKHLTKDTFVDILKALRASGTALSMDEVIDHVKARRPFPDYAFAVTFDDGFANNLTVAAPVLDDFGIPTTFYVTTDFIENNVMSWIDRIEAAIESAGKARLHMPWGEESFGNEQEKRTVLDNIRRHVKSDRTLNSNEVATETQVQLGKDPFWSGTGPLDQKLTWPQARQLAASPLFTIGGHTHTHPVMSFLEPGKLHDEIKISLRLIQENLGITCRHFAYPEGLRHCYGSREIEALKGYGIECCPTAEPGLDDETSDLFRLHRTMLP